MAVNNVIRAALLTILMIRRVLEAEEVAVHSPGAELHGAFNVLPTPVWRRHCELCAVAHSGVMAVQRARVSVRARNLGLQRQARLCRICRRGGHSPCGDCSSRVGGALAVIPPIQLLDELLMFHAWRPHSGKAVQRLQAINASGMQSKSGVFEHQQPSLSSTSHGCLHTSSTDMPSASHR